MGYQFNQFWLIISIFLVASIPLATAQDRNDNQNNNNPPEITEEKRAIWEYQYKQLKLREKLENCLEEEKRDTYRECLDAYKLNPENLPETMDKGDLESLQKCLAWVYERLSKCYCKYPTLDGPKGCGSQNICVRAEYRCGFHIRAIHDACQYFAARSEPSSDRDFQHELCENEYYRNMDGCTKKRVRCEAEQEKEAATRGRNYG